MLKKTAEQGHNKGGAAEQELGGKVNFTWNHHHQSPIIAYLTQGPAQACLKLKQRFQDLLLPAESYLFICHSYDEDCDGCIFQPKTSFAEGKNIIVKTLVNSTLEVWDRVKYVVSFDDDVPLYPGPFEHDDPNRYKESDPDSNDGWKPFHDLLLNQNTTHPFIKPQYPVDFKDKTTTYQTCTDENFWAIRKDHLHVVYPHSTIHSDFYWANAMRVFYLLHKCYPQAFQVVPDVRTHNYAHRYDTKGFAWGKIQEVALAQLEDGYPEIGPWEVGMYPDKQRCTVFGAPSLGLHPICHEVMLDRFQKWIDGQYNP
uniref:Uncharacterized protein n=1 Tax=Helicotheca tamesis TaxID=374047 RepID=A0A7S2HEZ8_9STRA|mmetsp:Transcript_17515/g.24153  ORF Transcript_17515/g.24153 Transcript_17515/m.24153 type:complete len:313 (+) Transcript_17515:2-940(+)